MMQTTRRTLLSVNIIRLPDAFSRAMDAVGSMR